MLHFTSGIHCVPRNVGVHFTDHTVHVIYDYDFDNCSYISRTNNHKSCNMKLIFTSLEVCLQVHHYILQISKYFCSL